MAIDLLEQIHPSVKDSIFTSRIIIPDWKMKESDIPGAESASFNDKSWTSIRVPFQWGKFNKIFWFRSTLTITEQFAGKPLVLRFDFPDALLFINGKVFHGLDQDHSEVLICEKARLHEKFVIAIRACSGRKNDHNLFGLAELSVLDTTARRLDSAFTVLHEYEKHLDHGSDELKEIRDLIRRTLVFLKYFKPGSEEYPNAIRRAYNFLLNTLETEYKTTLPGLIYLIGNTQIGHIGLQQRRELPQICARTFSSVLRLMDEFPELKYSQNQPALYELIKLNYPDLFKQIKQRMTEGKWEVLGAMWAEADCNLSSGESLVRQILYGKRFLKQEFGIDSSILWFPHSFGFNWALPQILLKSGVTSVYSSKFAQNDTTEFPYSSFWWQGIDKSKVLVHFSRLGFEAQISPKFLLESGVPTDGDAPGIPLLQTFGGTSGPTKENLEFAVVLKTLAGLPASQIATVQEFFQQTALPERELPLWNNELYLETHRGTFTTNGVIKKENRECERLLYTAELLSVLGFLYGKNAPGRKYPQSELEQSWKNLLYNQAQSILSGAAIADVSTEAIQDYQSIRNACTRIISRTVQSISQPAKKNPSSITFGIFNPLQWQRNAYIELDIKTNKKHLAVEDEQSQPVEFQILGHSKKEQKILCYVKNIPPLGFKHITIHTQSAPALPPEQWKTSVHGLETPFYRIRLDSKGAFSSMYAKHLRRELFEKGKRANALTTFRDTPKQLEAWNLDAEFEKHKTELWSVKQIKIIDHGPLRAAIRIELKTDAGSLLSQEIYFYHQSARIDFKTNVRWNEKQTLLKAVFPCNMKAAAVANDIQFGTLQRPSKPRSDVDKAKFEVPAQQWADISDSKYGISLLTNSKYGYDVKENVIRLTLLRSPHAPHPLDPSKADTAIIDHNDHQFSYALYPHQADWMKNRTIQHAQEFNSPVMVFPDILPDSIPPLVESSKPNIIIDSIKKAEESDSLILRMHEAYGSATDTVLHFGLPIASIFECSLLEIEEKQHKVNKSKLPIKFKPFEIRTFKLIVKPLNLKKKRKK